MQSQTISFISHHCIAIYVPNIQTCPMLISIFTIHICYVWMYINQCHQIAFGYFWAVLLNKPFESFRINLTRIFGIEEIPVLFEFIGNGQFQLSCKSKECSYITSFCLCQVITSFIFSLFNPCNMAHLTSDDRYQIIKAAKNSGSDVSFVGTNRTVIDGNTYYGRHDAVNKLQGS